MEGVIPGPRNLITDVPGIRIGNAQDERIASGVTVALTGPWYWVPLLPASFAWLQHAAGDFPRLTLAIPAPVLMLHGALDPHPHPVRARPGPHRPFQRLPASAR